MRRCAIALAWAALLACGSGCGADRVVRRRPRRATVSPNAVLEPTDRGQVPDQPDDATPETIANTLRLAHSSDPLPEAVTFSIVLCMPVHPTAQWRKTLLVYMNALQKRQLQREARAYEVVLCGGDEATYAEAGAIVKSICHSCIIHMTSHSVQVASVEAIARHGSDGLNDDEVNNHVILYIGHQFPGGSGEGESKQVVAAKPQAANQQVAHHQATNQSLPTTTLDGAPIFNSVAGGWAPTLHAFNLNTSVQMAGCGFDVAGRPLLNQWYVRASYVRKLVHPVVYFPNPFFHHMCGAGCVNDWMVTIDKQYRVQLDDRARVIMCDRSVIAKTVVTN